MMNKSVQDSCMSGHVCTLCKLLIRTVWKRKAMEGQLKSIWKALMERLVSLHFTLPYREVVVTSYTPYSMSFPPYEWNRTNRNGENHARTLMLVSVCHGLPLTSPCSSIPK